MGVFDAKTSQKGQVTVPAEVRKTLNLLPGGKLQFKVDDSGKVELVAKKRGLAHIKGLFAQPSEPINVEAEIMAEVWERNCPAPGAKRS